MDGRPLVSHRISLLEAFGSGELEKQVNCFFMTILFMKFQNFNLNL